MWHITKIIPVQSFTFGSYLVDETRSTVTFTYVVAFKFGITKTFTDTLFLKDVSLEMWKGVPVSVLEPTLQSLLLMIGINYWSAFRTKNIYIKNFTLTREQAEFWNTLYVHGLGEFFYLMKLDFRNLISFPYDAAKVVSQPTSYKRPSRTLLLNGAGKDSIVSAEMLKADGVPFDFFTFAPTPAHARIGKLEGVKTVSVTRRRDPLLTIIMVGSYPSVSTYTFIAILLSELMGYDSIVFSNERSADVGNLNYLGLEVNHQWCKSSMAEKMINDYIQTYVTPDIKTYSLLRELSELEIVQRFVSYPKYLYSVTSCNTYFWLPPIQQRFMRTNYWCNRCPKCVFLFACFSAYLPKSVVVKMFGANLYSKKSLQIHFKRILGIEGTKPLDCVGEPEEMILAMHYASLREEYSKEYAMKLFEENFPPSYNFDRLKDIVLPVAAK